MNSLRIVLLCAAAAATLAWCLGTGCGSSGGGGPYPTGTTPTGTGTGTVGLLTGKWEITIQERTVYGYTPEGLNASEDVPMLIAYPGSTVEARELRTFWKTAADLGAVIVAVVDWPDGLENEADEAARASLIRGELTARFPVDDERIYISGFSSGGYVAYITGLTDAQNWAGIVALTTMIPGGQDGVDSATRKIAVYISVGTGDSVHYVASQLDEQRLGHAGHPVHREEPNGAAQLSIHDAAAAWEWIKDYKATD